MKTEFVTQNFKETRELGKLLANELKGGEVICLFGELGAGKTTFTQGLLGGLGAEKPYTSPTFVVMKEYKTEVRRQKSVNPPAPRLRRASESITNVYHFDAYRVGADDILNLGWEEIIADNGNICIVEWADKLEKIIPDRAIWIGFEWLDDKRRKLLIGKKTKNLLKSQKHAKNT
ncbi:MAG: tRNA (adenosine(37)-N6)-threonylcarbamoyltransferase complex ATPase subunit type 1 TsaE [Candidatus Moraniibacteriota bacterium]|jgi:tRNA threonylcarbamoyladenosine biosynthesis protein TsaE